MTDSSPLAGALHQVGINVEDLGRAVGFYRDALGGTLLATFDPPGIAFFDCNGTRLMLSAVEEEGTSAAEAAAGGNSPLYFRVTDLDATIADLRGRGVEVAGEPHRIFADDEGIFGPAGSEEWMAFILDPEGNTLGLVEVRAQG